MRRWGRPVKPVVAQAHLLRQRLGQHGLAGAGGCVDRESHGRRVDAALGERLRGARGLRHDLGRDLLRGVLLVDVAGAAQAVGDVRVDAGLAGEDGAADGERDGGSGGEGQRGAGLQDGCALVGPRRGPPYRRRARGDRDVGPVDRRGLRQRRPTCARRVALPPVLVELVEYAVHPAAVAPVVALRISRLPSGRRTHLCRVVGLRCEGEVGDFLLVKGCGAAWRGGRQTTLVEDSVRPREAQRARSVILTRPRQRVREILRRRDLRRHRQGAGLAHERRQARFQFGLGLRRDL